MNEIILNSNTRDGL